FFGVSLFKKSKTALLLDQNGLCLMTFCHIKKQSYFFAFLLAQESDTATGFQKFRYLCKIQT
ncbi:MAG: hypothetical protein K2O20_08745, partial [Duncaniella sp.]|nr:hypothetical protein [Duncaniella sp.]